MKVVPPTAGARRLAHGRSARRRGREATGRGRRHPGDQPSYRVVRIGESGETVDVALSMAETEATLTQFDRSVAAGWLVFLALAVVGGIWLSRQALRPVARSIAAARELNPSDLTARLPRSGVGDEIDQLAATVNDLLDRLASYHGQMTRFTADASHELRGPLAAMRAAIEVLARPAPARRGLSRDPRDSGRAVRPAGLARQRPPAPGPGRCGRGGPSPRAGRPLTDCRRGRRDVRADGRGTRDRPRSGRSDSRPRPGRSHAARPARDEPGG